MEQFTDEEKGLLKPFCSNLEKDIFVLTNLPEVVKGTLFSKYSRSKKSLRRLLLEDFILDEKSGFREIVAYDEERGNSQEAAVKKAEEFYDRVLVGYGDDSVAELGGAHVACENVSNLASKVLEDSRIGLSPLEKSTRYVYFDEKPDGKYLYYEGEELLNSEYGDLYVETCDSLFDSYASLIEPTKKYLQEKFPKGEESDRAYNSTIRAKACDILRGFLPAATKTNLGLYGNGRSFEYLIVKMNSHELKEMRDIAKTMHEELMKVMPSFVKRATGMYGDPTSKFLEERKNAMQKISDELELSNVSGKDYASGEEVVLVDYDKDAEERTVGGCLYQFSENPLGEIKEKIKGMSEEERARIIREYYAGRQNRRHKPGRGFEYTTYSFDLLGNYGAYRDLHRHRVLTQQRQDLGTRNGFDTPPEMKEVGEEVEKEFLEKMNQAKSAYEKIRENARKEAQYVVPFAYRIRWSVNLNLRELYHLVELRSTIQGHPDYRRIVLKMHNEAKRVHPILIEGMKFVDFREFSGLERLEAEKATDKKMEALKEKYGE